MFVSHRTVRVDSLGASFSTHALVHSRYRVHVVERIAVISEDALLFRGFERKGAIGRPVVTALLEGRARIRAFGQERWLEPGDFSMLSHKSEIEMRQEPPYTSIVVEWEPGSLGPRPVVGFSIRKLAPASTLRLRQLATSLARNEDAVPEAASDLSSLLGVLRQEGAPFDDLPVSALIEDVTEQTRKVAKALDALHSSLSEKPMAVDLDAALGLSSRQVNRVVAAFNERYGYNAAGWRDTRNRWRLFVGATLMTAGGVSAERVAKAVGYSSTATFCRALADSGLPSPSEIGETVRALG